MNAREKAIQAHRALLNGGKLEDIARLKRLGVGARKRELAETRS